MANLQFRIPAHLIENKEIADFERSFKIILPDDYKQFLLETNGGQQPTPETFKIGNGEETFLKELFSLKEERSMALEKQVVQMTPILPKGIIPIGLDGVGNKICLDVSVENSGEVWFWDHEQENSTPLLFVNRSFREFLDSLYPDPDKPKLDEIEWIGKFGKTRDLLEFLAKGNSMEARNKYGRTILKEAARYGNIELLEIAIAHGAITSGASHMAAMNSRIEVIDALLRHGVDINERDMNGKTPLAVAWDSEFASVLKTKGAVK